MRAAPACRNTDHPMARLTLVAIPQEGRPIAEIGSLPSVALEPVAAMAALYRHAGYVPPWIGYLAVDDGAVVGTCAFKTPPRDGRVEIAYFTFPPYERRGIATAMARELLDIAFLADPALTVTAQTLPVPNTSNGILQKLGFAFVGSVQHGEDGEVWEWSRSAGAVRSGGDSE